MTDPTTPVGLRAKCILGHRGRRVNQEVAIAIKNRVGHAAAKAAELAEDLADYQRALETVRDFEDRHPEIAAGLSPFADFEPTGDDGPEEILGDNMQETIYLAALEIERGLEYEAEDVMKILRARAPAATKVWRIDEKKTRDALNRLANDPHYKRLKKTREGTRGSGAVQPQFTSLSEQDLMKAKRDALERKVVELAEQGKEREAEKALEEMEEIEKAMRSADTEPPQDPGGGD